jgi:hypothetical protein
VQVAGHFVPAKDRFVRMPDEFILSQHPFISAAHRAILPAATVGIRAYVYLESTVPDSSLQIV